MKLPEYPHVIFGRPPLALVVGQIRFSPQPGFADGSHLSDFAKQFRRKYPKSDRFEQFNVSISQAHGVEHQPGRTLWKFSSVEDDWSVVLGENALTLEVRGYTQVAEFLQRFGQVLDWLVETLDPGLQTRIGLRYIDEFRHEGAATIKDWSRLIKPELLGFATSVDRLFGSAPVEHTRQQFEVDMPDASKLMVRHGLLSGTSVEPVGNGPRPQGTFYLLDMDYYDAQPREINRDEVLETMRRYNETMYRFFRWVMLDDLYQSLEPRDEA